MRRRPAASSVASTSSAVAIKVVYIYIDSSDIVIQLGNLKENWTFASEIWSISLQ